MPQGKEQEAEREWRGGIRKDVSEIASEAEPTVSEVIWKGLLLIRRNTNINDVADMSDITEAFATHFELSIYCKLEEQNGLEIGWLAKLKDSIHGSIKLTRFRTKK